MKRYLYGLLATAALLSLAAPAFAGWKEEQIRWQRSNATEGLYFKSFTTTGAAAKVDTTEAFDLSAAVPFPLALGWGGTTLDTVVVAKLVIYGDSTTASTISFGSTSVSIQANSGANATGWQAARTIATLNTDGQKYVEVPIYASNNAVSKQLYIDRTGDFSLFGAQLRAIATLTGATAVPTMRVKLVYWSND